MEIVINKVYKHIKKGGIYFVKDITKMKHPDTNNWIECVIYQSLKDGKNWVRSTYSFLTHFEEVPESKLATL